MRRLTMSKEEWRKKKQKNFNDAYILGWVIMIIIFLTIGFAKGVF